MHVFVQGLGWIALSPRISPLYNYRYGVHFKTPSLMLEVGVATIAPGIGRYPALEHRNFRLIWLGLLVSNMGTWMQNVAQNWLIFKLTGHNPLYLGLIGLAFAVPMIVFPPLGGAICDRVDRVKLLYVTQTGSLLLAVGLAIFTWAGIVRPAHILVTTFVGAVLLAFDNPTRQAFIPDLVPREDLLNALSLNSATFTGAALVGPALAGLLLNSLGAGWLFLLNAVSYIAVIRALATMRNIPPRRPVSTSFRDALLGGFVYVWQQRIMGALLLLSIVAAVFGRSYQQLLPVFAEDVWHTGARGYGILLSAGGAGALIGAFGMASIREVKSPGLVVLGSGLLMCVALAAFALSHTFAVGAGLLLAVGFLANVFTTMIATILQLRVPGDLRGRVVSLYAVTLIGAPSLGSLGAASMAHWLGQAPLHGPGHVLNSALNAVGVLAATRQLGNAAGGPRAIVLGALVLGCVLAAVAPGLWRVQFRHTAASAPR
ncbi:MAG: MFS transporter [Herpetosiphon sp.]